MARAVAAGRTVAGAAREAGRAARADRRAGAVLRPVHGHCAAGQRVGEGAAGDRGAAVYPAERAGRARARAQDAEPDVDQRDHAHQAERLRDALALCQLVLCPRAWRAVLPVRQCAECSGVSGHLRRRDGGGQRAAAPLGETAGRAHLRRALKEKRKPPRSKLDRGGFLLRNALTARATGPRRREP